MARKPLNDFPDFLAGDMIAVQGVGLFSDAIRRLETDIPDPWRIQTEKASFSHTAPVYNHSIVIEAVGGIRLAPVSEYQNTRVEVYRYRRFDPARRQKFKMKALGRWNRQYGWGKILLFALVALTRSYAVMNRLGFTSLQVCSQFAAWLIEETFGHAMIPQWPWQDVDPQVFRDYCRAHPNEWELVYKTPA